MKIVATSDIHGFEPVLPEGDVLVLAGDLTSHGSVADVRKLNSWLSSIAPNWRAMVVVAGNHDWWFQQAPPLAVLDLTARWHAQGIHYLEDTGVTIDGVKFWGSPWTPKFYDWAFMDTDRQLRRYWDMCPEDTRVLVTHGGPWGVLDLTQRGPNAGSDSLLSAVGRIQPEVHIFGHIHEAYGELEDKGIGTHFYNVAHCNLQYEPVQPPVVIDIESEVK
jgi:Icc-related predicted phosphoesterase